MPEAVLEYVNVDYILNPPQIAPLLVESTEASKQLAGPPDQLPKKESMESREPIDARCPDWLGPAVRSPIWTRPGVSLPGGALLFVPKRA